MFPPTDAPTEVVAAAAASICRGVEKRVKVRVEMVEKGHAWGMENLHLQAHS
jgi:hypothetical protein